MEKEIFPSKIHEIIQIKASLSIDTPIPFREELPINNYNEEKQLSTSLKNTKIPKNIHKRVKKHIRKVDFAVVFTYNTRRGALSLKASIHNPK